MTTSTGTLTAQGVIKFACRQLGAVPVGESPSEAEAMAMVREGAADMVAVSLGEDGALLATLDGVLRMASPPIPGFLPIASRSGSQARFNLTGALCSPWSALTGRT